MHHGWAVLAQVCDGEDQEGLRAEPGLRWRTGEPTDSDVPAHLEAWPVGSLPTVETSTVSRRKDSTCPEADPLARAVGAQTWSSATTLPRCQPAFEQVGSGQRITIRGCTLPSAPIGHRGSKTLVVDLDRNIEVTLEIL